MLAAALKLRFPEIDAIARITTQTVILERDSVKAQERIYWADPALSRSCRCRRCGDLRALERPDGYRLTRALGRPETASVGMIRWGPRSSSITDQTMTITADH